MLKQKKDMETRKLSHLNTDYR